MLPEVDRTKLEITNPQFRIIEKTDPSDGMKLYYPQRKLWGLFWVGVVVNETRVIRYPRIRTYKRYSDISKCVAEEVIEKFKNKKYKQELSITYL